MTCAFPLGSLCHACSRIRRSGQLARPRSFVVREERVPRVTRYEAEMSGYARDVSTARSHGLGPRQPNLQLPIVLRFRHIALLLVAGHRCCIALRRIAVTSPARALQQEALARRHLDARGGFRLVFFGCAEPHHETRTLALPAAR